MDEDTPETIASFFTNFKLDDDPSNKSNTWVEEQCRDIMAQFLEFRGFNPIAAECGAPNVRKVLQKLGVNDAAVDNTLDLREVCIRHKRIMDDGTEEIG